MEVTGKCKEAFTNWLNNHSGMRFSERELFYNNRLPDSMRFGVYVDFFDSVGFTLLIDTESYDVWWVTILEKDLMSSYFESCEPIETATRHEARTKAIEKANKIYNQTKDEPIKE